MKKSYQYNTEGLAKVMKKFRIKKVDIQRLFGYVNSVQINRWVDGGDIYISKACEICAAFDLDFVDTFLSERITETHEPAMSEVRTGNERPTTEDVLRMRQETLGMSANSLSEMMAYIEAARNKEYERCQKAIAEERKKAQEKVDQLMERMESIIIEKNEEVLKEKEAAGELMLQKRELEMRYEELARQYRELELKSNSFTGPIGVAEHPYAKR